MTNTLTSHQANVASVKAGNISNNCHLYFWMHDYGERWMLANRVEAIHDDFRELALLLGYTVTLADPAKQEEPDAE